MASSRFAETRLHAASVWAIGLAAFVTFFAAPLHFALAQFELPSPAAPARGAVLPSVPTRIPARWKATGRPKPTRQQCPHLSKRSKAMTPRSKSASAKAASDDQAPGTVGRRHSLHCRGRSIDRRFRSASKPADGPYRWQAPGVTDLSVTTADNQSYSFEIHVVYGLDLLRQLKGMFPDADIRLAQIGASIVVEGQAHSPPRSPTSSKPFRHTLTPSRDYAIRAEIKLAPFLRRAAEFSRPQRPAINRWTIR